MAELPKKRRIEGCKCYAKKQAKELGALKTAEKFVEDAFADRIEEAISLYKAAGKCVPDLVDNFRNLAVRTARTMVATKVLELMDDYHSLSYAAEFDVVDSKGEKFLTTKDEDHDAIIEALHTHQTIKVQIAKGHGQGMHVILSIDPAEKCFSNCAGLDVVLEKARSLERKLLVPKPLGE